MKNKNLYLVVVLIYILAFAGCKKEKGCTDINAANYDIVAEKDDGSCLINSVFPSLNGKYDYYYYWSDDNGIEEISEYEYWEFDDTRKVLHYSCYWSYSIANGWTNASKEGAFDDYEWKIEDEFLYYKIWQNESSNWKPLNFVKIDNNNFTLNSKLFEKELFI